MALIPFHTMAGTIDLAALQPGDMTAFAIGDALAKINRFGGRTPHPWSVASHSLLVERLCSHDDLRGWALLHDAHEVFLGDWTTPAVELLCASGTRSAIENALHNAKGRIDRMIGAAWECAPRALSLEVRHADWIALQAEMLCFFQAPVEALKPDDREAVARACDLIPELPQGANWIAAREAWIERATDLASLGLLRLPQSNPATSAALAG